MSAPIDSIKDRLSRYREIHLGVTGRKSGRDHLSAGLVRVEKRMTRSTCCRYEARTHSGTRTCLKTHPFRSTCAAQRLNLRPFRLPITPSGFRPWSKSSAPSTGQAM